jgi:Zn-dependent protease with chaperone function
MVIISEFFLRHSEWRQQDAWVGALIGLVKRKVSLHTFLGKLISCIIVGAYFLVLPFTNSFSTDLLALTIILLSPLLLLIGAYILISVISAYSQRLETRDYIEADRLASFLTGDPVAVMVALNLVRALNGVTINQQDERMRNLDELARQPWSRAPQAALPVPAVCEASYDSHLLTTSMDWVTAPGPVPAAPYR